MDINYNNLREGDIFFAHKGILGTNINSCGFIIKPFGGKLFYVAEIKDGKIVFNSFKNVRFIYIRRPIGIFNDEIERIKFRKNIIRIREESIIENKGKFTDSICFIKALLPSIPLSKDEFVYNTRYFTDVQYNSL